MDRDMGTGNTQTWGKDDFRRVVTHGEGEKDLR